MAEINNIPKYESTNSGNSWNIRPTDDISYILSENHNERVCYSTKYTPTSGAKITQIDFTCNIAVTSASGRDYQHFVQLYTSQYPSGTPILTVDVTKARWKGDGENGSAYQPTTFSFIIPDDIVINEETYLCFRIYGWSTSNNEYVGWDGTAVITETAIYRDVVYMYGDEEIVDKKVPGEVLTLRGATFYCNGYSQIGWAITDGGEITYALGSNYELDEELTLYPVWSSAPSVVLWMLINQILNGDFI